MTLEAAEVIARLQNVDLCTVAVVGIRPNGGGLYIDWSGETIHSLITHLQAGCAEAVQTFIDQTKVDHDAKDAA